MTDVNQVWFTIVNMEFITWLNKKREARGWTFEELGDRSGFSKSYVSLVMSGERSPTRNFCAGIAKAFGIEENYVLTMAGHNPTGSRMTESEFELLEIFRELNNMDQDKVISYAQFLKK